MSDVEQALRQALSQVVPDALQQDLVAAGAVKDIRVGWREVKVRVQLGYPCDSLLPALRLQLESLLAPLVGSKRLALELDWKVVAHRTQQEKAPLPKVKNLIAVASGKGGVGKSTTTANLALALAQEGARVGVLDADIFGPSMPTMFGIKEGTRPEIRGEQHFVPPRAHGVQLMSIGFMIDPDTAVVWRGPKASGALQQLATQTLWEDLDYLLVDLPPGTSDIQLTLAQRLPVAGSVVVTTPQEIALADARKGIEMFQKVDINVLGVVENMALHQCSQCGHVDHLFGEGGGTALAGRYRTELLGSMPLVSRIRVQADAGTPVVMAAPDSLEAGLYRSMARRMTALLSLRPGAPQSIVKMAMRPN